MFPTTQSSITDLSSALAQSKVHHADNSSAGKAFLKFNFKDGSFTFGRDQEDITGEEIVVNVATFAHGWTLWVNGQPQKVDRKSTRLNSSHVAISYAVFCLKKKKNKDSK